jgi:Ras-related protein Rab-22
MYNGDDDDDDFITLKVVLLGESGVGKTSIIQRYINNSFNPGISTTGGANFTTKLMDFKEEKQKIKFEIWDTAGQEKFRSLAKVFYKNASICILVYDITRRESFEELENFWIEEVRNCACSDISNFYYFII